MKNSKIFQIKSIIFSAALYDLAGMFNIFKYDDMDDDQSMRILSVADSFSNVHDNIALFESALDQYETLTVAQKYTIEKIEKRILASVNPKEFSIMEFKYKVNSFLNQELEVA